MMEGRKLIAKVLGILLCAMIASPFVVIIMYLLSVFVAGVITGISRGLQ